MTQRQTVKQLPELVANGEKINPMAQSVYKSVDLAQHNKERLSGTESPMITPGNSGLGFNFEPNPFSQTQYRSPPSSLLHRHYVTENVRSQEQLDSLIARENAFRAEYLQQAFQEPFPPLSVKQMDTTQTIANWKKTQNMHLSLAEWHMVQQRQIGLALSPELKTLRLANNMQSSVHISVQKRKMLSDDRADKSVRIQSSRAR